MYLLPYEGRDNLQSFSLELHVLGNNLGALIIRKQTSYFTRSTQNRQYSLDAGIGPYH